jgi:hypothetical protein
MYCSSLLTLNIEHSFKMRHLYQKVNSFAYSTGRAMREQLLHGSPVFVKQNGPHIVVIVVLEHGIEESVEILARQGLSVRVS